VQDNFWAMMLPSLLHLASALVLGQSLPSANHTWIADVKANRASLVGKEVRVEGLVVDIRSTASEGRRGLYRLIDESDREGVLVRTTDLPAGGGAYRVRSMVASRQPADGSLLLEEISRKQTDKRSSLPIVLALLSGITLVVLAALTIRAIRTERQYLVSPPLWLLPNAGPYGKNAPAATGQPSLTYNPDLEESDRRQRDNLKTRRRTLLRALVVALITLSVSGAWLVAGKPSSAPIPAFILIGADEMVAVVPPPAPILDTLFADRPIEQHFDSTLTEKLPRRDTANPRRPPVTVLAVPNRRPDTTTRTPVPASPLPPSPLPASPLPPSPVPPSPAPAPAPAAPDPEEERRLATGAAAEGIGRVVTAINGKRVTELLVLVPEEMAGDPARLERFVGLVKGFGPRATLGGVEPLALADDRGEARFTVSFVWRGDFGVERRKTGRFIGVVRRQEGEWRFAGARLLDAIP